MHIKQPDEKLSGCFFMCYWIFLKISLKSYQMKNYYDILEISPEATRDEIKSAFRAKARKYHPDVNHTLEAEILFKQVNLAAKTLLDDTMRSQYDFAYGFNQKKKETKETCNSFEKKEEKKTYEDFTSSFYAYFRNKKKEKPQKNPKKINGQDIITHINITSSEAISGTSRKVNILTSEKCPKCFGSKFINGSKCTFCDGKGEKTQYKKINVKIPPNVRDGIKIRVKNEGEEGKFGGKNGDLYLVVHVEKNAAFKSLDGLAFIEVPISPYEAVLGAQIKIPIPDNGTKILKIPPKTRTNTIFKLMESGFLNAQTNTRDPLLVKVVIDILPQLGDKEVELYREISDIYKGDLREDIRKYG